jgi:hypothetical protein
VGMNGIVCALSAKRRELIEEEPELLVEVIQARRREPIRGLLDLGKAWHALDVMLGEGDDPLLGDVVLARSGAHLGPELAFGRPLLLDPGRVKEVAEALAELPEDWVESRYAALAGKKVHGGYGPRAADPDDDEALQEEEEREELGNLFARLVALYRDAAARGESVLAIVV